MSSTLHVVNDRNDIQELLDCVKASTLTLFNKENTDNAVYQITIFFGSLP